MTSSSEGRALVFAAWDRQLRVFDLASEGGRCVSTLRLDCSPTSLAATPQWGAEGKTDGEGELLLVGDQDGRTHRLRRRTTTTADGGVPARLVSLSLFFRGSLLLLSLCKDNLLLLLLSLAHKLHLDEVVACARVHDIVRLDRLQDRLEVERVATHLRFSPATGEAVIGDRHEGVRLDELHL
eukprot:CAMPEP_0170163966 /NCGR_PEP_ID=MMETSP0033_2-20121228/77866_1 /TAXON_ID=195969 /ORGANISM="Dolichomastix tenuilepis, Strain CCMP3274" /LENGTH=181 /DNA_ID=CAMNT_0010401603 /DNA_START=86 /DNA_END=631 /DNA_ORIENTATION=+